MNEQAMPAEGVNNEQEDGGDVGQIAAVVVPVQPLHAPRTIIVVDDELYQLRRIHVQNVAPDFYTTVTDVNDPIFDNLWDVAKAVPELDAVNWDHDAAAAYFASDAAVAGLLLTDQFSQIALAPLQAILNPFSSRAVWVADLKMVFQDAFPAPDFNLQFAAPPRPNFHVVSQCAAVFLDLFLEHGEVSPVEAVQAHLRQLATDAGASVLPPLVLMSSHPELEQHKLKFSERAGISAAGLMVLPKAALMQEEFRASGLKLAFKQLDRQKNVAHAMRLFMGSWLDALDQAKKNAASTLWNLDASAMQQIHFASISDDDPYDEHLNELLSREHLFHVEAEARVASSVAELDRQFRLQQSPDGQIENRLMAPQADVKTARAFVSHFTWFGSALPASFMGDEEGAAAGISRSLPFGSVLSQMPLKHGSKCLVHITQQCDVNAISRSKQASRTLTFATADAHELQASSNPIITTTELVAKGLRVGRGIEEREFDLRLNDGELLAMPLRDFLGKSRLEGWAVVGRLRSDITNHIVASTTNHMTRPASQKMIRPGLLKSKVFLQAAAFNGGKTALLDKDSPAANKPAKVFFVSRDGDRYSFEDEACIEIALWLVHHSATINLPLDADLLSAALRRGWTSPAELPGGIRARVRDCEDLNAAFRGLVGGDIGGGSAQLTVIFER